MQAEKEDFNAVIKAVDDSLAPLFLLLESTVDECIQFTDGTEAEALTSLCEVDSFFFF